MSNYCNEVVTQKVKSQNSKHICCLCIIKTRFRVLKRENEILLENI